MREIKFRALIEYIGEHGESEKYWEYYSTFDQPPWLEERPDRHIVVKDLQYTGLRDKNGKEIFEGDVIAGVFEDPVVVKFGEHTYSSDGDDETGYGCFSQTVVGWYMGDEDNPQSADGFGLYEIIGNIYENPELLKT